MIRDAGPQDARFIQALRLLRRAAGKGMYKSALAEKLFGEVTGSTQSMTTRLTQQLKDNGWTEEIQEGRTRRVRITDEGATWLRSGPPASKKTDGYEPLSTSSTSEDPEEYPRDRMRAILHASAVHLAADQVETVAPNKAFAAGLRSLIDEKSVEGEYAELGRIALRGSLDADRFGILELAVRAQDPSERARMANDVVRMGQRLRPRTPEALLWVVPAVSVAARAGLSEDRDQRRLREGILGLVRPHLDPLASFAKGPTLVADGRSALAMESYEAMTDAWLELAQMVPSSHPALEQKDPQLANHLRKCEEGLIDAGKANVLIERCVRIERGHILPRVVSGVRGASEHILGKKSVDEIVAWAVDHGSRIAAVWQRALQSLSDEHKAAFEGLAGLPPTAIESVVRGHRKRAQWVLSERWGADPAPRPKHPITVEFYRDQVLNNQWLTSMIWSDLAWRSLTWKHDSTHPEGVVR